MKIATSLWGFRERDLPEVLTFCADTGITSVEAQAHAQAPRQFRLDMSDAELDGILRLAAQAGITFDAMALANDFTTSEERLSGEIERTIAGLDFARRLGITRVRVFAGWKQKPDMNEAIFNRMIDALRVVARHAGKLGIRVGVENHGGITAAAGDVQRILDAVGNSSLGLLYDPANFVRSSEDPVAALRALRLSLVYTHAKDLTSDGKVCAVGQGVMPWPAILAELAKDPDTLIVIEQTNPADVIDSTRQSFAALQSAEVMR